MIDISKMKRKIFDINTFMDTYLIYEHKKVVEKLNFLEENNEIKPIKSSPLSIKYPQIHTKYRVCERENFIDEDILKEINFKLNSKIKIDFIRNNVDIYIKNRENILLLNDFFNTKDCISERISLNERSYEIFGNEKYLSSKEGKELLKMIGLDYESLNIYLTPEPFFFSSSSSSDGQTVLIVENKDTYITLLKVMDSCNGMVLGHKIDTLIYGEGKKIISSFNSIYEDSNLDFLNSDKNIFYYWGDIDKEGFYIYGLLKKQFESVNISLFEIAYKLMIDKYKSVKIKRKCPKEQSKNYKIGMINLEDSILSNLTKILEDGYYIPQEILSLKEFNKFK